MANLSILTSKILIGISTFFILLLVPWENVLAAPQPPKLVVNHESKQCAEIFGGDECMDCFPPEGWKVLDYSYEVECPADYKWVENVDYTCQSFKDQFCCTQGHSGAAGDCEDLIINRSRRQCAFVESIVDCNLPRGWEKRPDDLELYNWTCPGDHDWVDTIDCMAEPSDDGETPPSSLPCLGSILIGPAIIGLWLVGKGNR